MVDKKYYAVGVYTSQDWQTLHDALTTENSSISYVPSRPVEVTDMQEHSETRAVYLLTDEEAQELSKHPNVKFVNINYTSYPNQFKPPKDELHCIFRYPDNVFNYRNFSDPDIMPTVLDTEDINRAGYQLLRSSQYLDPWYGSSSQSILYNRIDMSGTGIDVDIVVGDEGCWFGHVEFNSDSGSGPTNYLGGNALSKTGKCSIIDLVLEAPYYIDPAWFNANPLTRLTTRWDGTTVPVESVARAWWTTASQRSVAFQGIGTIPVPDTYDRLNCNGNNDYLSNEGDHGTCCAALTWGRTQGWAYNANKFFVNVYGNYGIGIEPYFDMLKIFHQYKPINPNYGTRNPTVSSNSWGYRATIPSTGAYYFRQGTSGTGGVTYSSKPAFLEYLGSTGDSNRAKGEMVTNSMTEAGAELVQSGVIFIVAAGNSNQKQVGSNQPDYNNYWATGLNIPLASATHDEFGATCYNTTSRRGFPQQIGQYIENGEVIYPAINVGALDDQYQPDGKERKVNYSDMGDQIDVFAPADGTLAANRLYPTEYLRADTYAGAGIPSGITGICNNSNYISGTTAFDTIPNTGWRIITSSALNGTVAGLTPFLRGGAGIPAYTTPTSGDNDDGYWGFQLPFTIRYAGTNYSFIYISTNSMITFSQAWINPYNLSPSNPAIRKIFLSAADNSCQRLYAGILGSAPTRQVFIRFEGTDDTSGILGSPNMVWEAYFYENANTQIDIQTGVNGRQTALFFDTAFSGTSAACPVTAGFISTVLQYNRNWTWKEVRQFLHNLPEQDATRFYQGPDPSTATSSNWSDLNSLMGGARRVLYNETDYTSTNGSGLIMTNVGFTP